MSHAQGRAHIPLDAALREMLQPAMEPLSRRARAYDRILKSPAPSWTWLPATASSNHISLLYLGDPKHECRCSRLSIPSFAH